MKLVNMLYDKIYQQKNTHILIFQKLMDDFGKFVMRIEQPVKTTRISVPIKP